MTVYLLDKSATAARHGPGVAARLRQLADSGELAVCQMTALELLYSARSPADYESAALMLRSYVWLDTTTECLESALTVQRQLASTSRHRVPIPDLVIAATAARYGATVLHDDKDFDLIAEVTGWSMERV